MVRRMVVTLGLCMSLSAYGGDGMECEKGLSKVLSNGTLYEMGSWTEWRIVKCPGEKASLRILGEGEMHIVHKAESNKLMFLGFIDGSHAARKLEDIGSTWRISAGVHGQKTPIWLLREGSSRWVFIDAGDAAFSVLGVVDAGCGHQIDVDPSEGAIVVTVRKGPSGDVIEEKTWTLSR